jgi:translation initiation factor eIF-2B subunit alpha
MSARDQEILDGLFRDLVDVYTASHTSLLALEGFAESLRQLRVSKDRVRGEIQQLGAVIINSRPRLFPLDNLIESFLEEMQEQCICQLDSVEDVVSAAIAILEGQAELLESNVSRVVGHGAQCVEDGDVVIVHAMDGTVKRILPEAKRQGRVFRVLILGQDFVKTKQVIKAMAGEGIDHLVLPEYSLTHFIGEASKLFLSSQAVTSDDKFVSDNGTASIVGTSHLHGLPIYLFVNSLKLTHWTADDQKINLKEHTKSLGGVEYAHVSHSHDVVDLALVDHVITEEGEIDKAEIHGYRVIRDR